MAGELGCFSCHGPGGVGDVPNPGSHELEVPGWTGGTLMMYVEKPGEIEEWIRDGIPQRLKTSAHTHEAVLHMPAFGDLISDAELADLAAYVRVVGGLAAPEKDAALDGYRVAAKLGCFGCHGPGGRTGASNPRGYKRAVPAWTGDDFKELVHDEEELRSWILNGTISRFEKNPLAQFFFRRQVIRMPSYRDVLEPEELDALVAYIEWLRNEEDGAALQRSNP